MSHGDAISFLSYIQVMLHCLFTIYTVYEMPVFAPNDYFWKHHWDGKEEKWVAYSRAVRQIMIERGGFEDSHLSLEDKVEYKSLIRGRKVSKPVKSD